MVAMQSRRAFILFSLITLTSSRSSSTPVETKKSTHSTKTTTAHGSSSKASSSHSHAFPIITCVVSEFPAHSRNVAPQIHVILTAFSSFTRSSSPPVVESVTSLRSTSTSPHALSSAASTFNAAAATTGQVSQASNTSKIAYLSIGGAMGGFALILIIAFIVSLSRRRKRRHSVMIPGIRHPFRPTNIAEPFSGALKLYSYVSRVRLSKIKVLGMVTGCIHARLQRIGNIPSPRFHPQPLQPLPLLP